MKPCQHLLRFAAVAALSTLWSCTHGIRNVSDCGQSPKEQRIACAACTVQNDAGGLMGEFEYRPDNAPANRCVKKN
ncbi:MAG: hypothetical protein NVS2B9_19730 [Myxococcales bacterium]